MYKVVIGLEVHCELKSNSKNFSSSTNKYNNIPNTSVSVVDLGLPGILPVTNEETVKSALKMALALNCETPDEILFDRKNYYYPDLTKGYQITQSTKPFGRNGKITYWVNENEKTVYIHQLHLEEDTASLEHYDTYSLIDYNRSGIPLLEIVTEPCINSADEAIGFLESLRNIFIYTDVSEARNDKGQIRCDVNISLMEENAKKLGTKVEIKNINSFNAVREAIEYEITRQTNLLNIGEKIIQETRRISEDGKTYSMRTKVDSVDYKYFVEPNIPPIKITNEFLNDIKKYIPELPYEKIKKYLSYNLTIKEASVIARKKELANYFENVYDLVTDKSSVKNWILSYLIGELNKFEIDVNNYNVNYEDFSYIINLVNQKKLNQLKAKEILTDAQVKKISPKQILNDLNIKEITEEDLIKLIDETIEENPIQLNDYLNGKEILANFFVGQIMKKTNKGANPELAFKLIKQQLENRR